jgi:hypothetical protein
MATAVATGKKSAKTGVRRVPNPKPEKRVKQEAASALTLMIRRSIPNPIGLPEAG